MFFNNRKQDQITKQLVNDLQKESVSNTVQQLQQCHSDNVVCDILNSIVNNTESVLIGGSGKRLIRTKIGYSIQSV